MNIFKLSIKNIFSRPLSSVLSILLLSLGVSMISLLILINTVLKDQMDNNLKGIDMVVGAKGSPLQLILSSVYHVDSPTGNIPLKDAKAIEQNRMVGYSVPLLYGDNYRGYSHPSVGTCIGGKGTCSTVLYYFFYRRSRHFSYVLGARMVLR